MEIELLFDCFIIYIDNMNKETKESICYCLKNINCDFEVKNYEIVVTSNIYKALFRLSDTYNLYIF